MFNRPHFSYASITFTALCAVLLTLWLNVAYVEHHLDITPSHHTQHHCQHFAGLQHGLSCTIPVLPTVIGGDIPFTVERIQRRPSVHYAYLARSPPLF